MSGTRFRRLLASVFALAVLLATAGLVFAGTQGSDCSGDTSKVRLWENAVGDTQDNNDTYWKCSSDTDLGSSGDNHTLAGDCAATPFGSSTWNDCVSSFTIWVPSGQRFCLYADDDYGAFKAQYIGPLSGLRYDVGVGWNDKLTSFKWTSGSC